MANNLKSSVDGIDKPIQALQTAVYKALESIIRPDKVLNGYGRVYRNRRGDSFVFEAYTGNGEYKDISGEDVSNFFFYVSESDNIADLPTSTVNIIFILNLDDFYNENRLRNDEEIKGLVYNTLLGKKSINLSSRESGTTFVANLLDGYWENKTVSTYDMHPYLVFTIIGEVSYNYKNC